MKAGRIFKCISFCLLILLLTGCMEPNHSVQTGTVDQMGTIEISNTLRNEKTYQKGIQSFNNGRNIKISPDEIEHLKTHYIQFRDNTQNLVIGNYNVWLDQNKKRIIFTDSVKEYSYYEIEDKDAQFVQNLMFKDEVSK
ncbi:hypothetical protein ACWV26_08900 [Rummeliibacillus sp. JY-2-4R]